MSYITDLAGLVNTSSNIPELKHSTSRKQDTTQLDMTDFLNLMVVQLQNQTMDNTMDTSDMLNQMVQMQMITALTNMTDASVMTYASSLVGKEVTIGDYSTGELVEKVVTITGSGVSNGENVLFAGNEVYKLSSVMAVGRLPEEEEEGEGGEDEDDAVDGVEGSDKPTGGTGDTDKTEGAGDSDKTEGAGGADKTEGEGSGETGGAQGADKVNGNGGIQGADGKTETIDKQELAVRQGQAIRGYLRTSGMSVPENATEEELGRFVDDYLKALEEAEDSEDVSQEMLQAARTLLSTFRINMAQDSTDAEIFQAALAVLRSTRPEPEQKESESEDEDEEKVEQTQSVAEEL